MNTDRLWVIAAVAVMAIIAVGGYFLGISPVLSSAVAANAQASTITTSNNANVAKLASLKSQYAHISTLQASLDTLRTSIPTSANASGFLTELNALSAAHNVTLTTVTIASATVYAAPGTTAGSTSTATTPGSTATPTPTPTATPAATGTATTTPAAAPTGGLVQVPVSIVASGSFSDVRDFIGAVQTGDRLYVATSVGISSGSSSTGGGSATGTLTGDIFTLAGSSTPEATPAPVLPTPTPTATATPTGIPTTTPTPTSTPTTKP